MLCEFVRRVRGGAVRWVFGKSVKSVSERRAEYIAKLEKVAELEEARNKVLEERLEFKRREAEVLARIKAARRHRRRLWELLGEFGVRKPGLLRWVLLGAFALILFLVVKAC
jgi:hypothetical protein